MGDVSAIFSIIYILIFLLIVYKSIKEEYEIN